MCTFHRQSRTAAADGLGKDMAPISWASEQYTENKQFLPNPYHWHAP